MKLKKKSKLLLFLFLVVLFQPLPAYSQYYVITARAVGTEQREIKETLERATSGINRERESIERESGRNRELENIVKSNDAILEQIRKGEADN